DRYQTAADVHLALEQANTPVAATRRPLPFATRRVALAVLLLIISLPIAGSVAYRLVSKIAPDAFSNSRGYSLLRRGDFDGAVEQFAGVTTREPDDANAWDSLGEGYLAAGMADKSLDAYSRALAIRPTFESSIRGRALALARLGR